MKRPARNKLDFRGDLQAEVMAAVWKLGEAQVDDVRAQQRRRTRSAYTTIQTVMNRLLESGLLTRERKGRAYVYKPRYDEAEHLAKTIGERLEGASPEARRAALVHLVDGLEHGDLDEVARYATKIRRARGRE